ncbi:hypothetical protein C8A00DRAFT_18623 [Chaetomidium leptoderma]|uniref:Uncharacterized protein n=1 Tax=Chaetomidium leptoderma TaxID=669021 RepID=A0AAN6VE01_9PEZI|nr:hypothetical protein C8A00DRAFT_18623 [Chaetomidium leptoderma]
MCRVCQRLGIVIEGPPPGLFAQEYAEQAYLEQKQLEYWAAREDHPPAPRKHLRSQPTPKVVVEPAPSHDGAPTFAAWSIYPMHLDAADPDNTADGYSDSPPKQDPEKHRPKFAMRVYDATETATAERTARLVRRVAELTRERRMSVSTEYAHEDRIEVVALPLPACMTAEERALKCVEHNKAERAARLGMEGDAAALAASWYLVVDDLDDSVPGSTRNLRKLMWVIHDLKDSWEEALRRAEGLGRWELEKLDQQGAHGHFLAVSYDVDRSWYDDEGDEDLDEDRPRPEFFVQEYALEWLGEKFYQHLEWNLKEFENHFVAKGVLEVELALARAAATGVEIPRPVVIPYVHEEPEWKKAWREGKLPWAPYPSR